MFTIIKLALALGTAQLGEFKSHTGRRVMYSSVLGVFGFVALIFGLAAATAALAAMFGLVYALLIMAGAALFCCIVTLIMMNLAERKHRRIAAEQHELRDRLQQLAVVTAMGAAGGRPGIAKIAGLGVVGVAALMALKKARAGSDD
jgi:cobalamin synthase